jgi:hypothetical protein
MQNFWGEKSNRLNSDKFAYIRVLKKRGGVESSKHPSSQAPKPTEPAKKPLNAWYRFAARNLFWRTDGADRLKPELQTRAEFKIIKCVPKGAFKLKALQANGLGHSHFRRLWASMRSLWPSLALPGCAEILAPLASVLPDGRRSKVL